MSPAMRDDRANAPSRGASAIDSSSIARLRALPSIPLAPVVTPVHELPRLREALGGGPRLLVKRDDALPFAFGGNKVRKMQLVAAEAQAHGADVLITTGGVQSNHARVTAAAAARLGMRSVLVLNGEPPDRPSGNALLDAMLGAEVRYVPTRADRTPAAQAAARELEDAGSRPWLVPLGASTPLGAAAFALAMLELVEQIPPPDVLVVSTSSGGTQAGLIAGCRLLGLRTRVVGISADDPAVSIEAEIRRILEGLELLVAAPPGALTPERIEIDDRFVGPGYGISTDASEEALTLAARREAVFLDRTYTAKAMAGLIAGVREGRFSEDSTILFWHTGGQVGLFAR